MKCDRKCKQYLIIAAFLAIWLACLVIPGSLFGVLYKQMKDDEFPRKAMTRGNINSQQCKILETKNVGFSFIKINFTYLAVPTQK